VARRKMLKLATLSDIRRALARINNMMLNGEVDSKTGAAMVSCCNAILASMRLDDQQTKIDELERLLKDVKR